LALEADARRPKKDRRTALMLFKETLNEGYTGGYSIVCDFICRWRNRGVTGKLVYVPLRFELGKAFQFDWSEEQSGDWRHSSQGFGCSGVNSRPCKTLKNPINVRMHAN